MTSTTDNSSEHFVRSESVVVGIPAYNEEATIGDVVDGALSYAEKVIVVDDGSSDLTVEQAQKAGAVVVEHDQNKGYGGALKTLFNVAHHQGTDHLIILDADGQHDPGDLETLAASQRKTGAEIVIGSRFAEDATTDAPVYRRFGLAVINGLTNASLRFGYGMHRLTDTQSGFRMYDATAIRTLSGHPRLNDGMDASLDILFIAAEKGYTIEEVPIDITYDVEGSSTHHPIRQGVTLLVNMMWRLYTDKPLRMLNIQAVCLISLAIAFSSLTLIGISSVASVPILIIGIILLVGGILSIISPFLIALSE